MHYGSILTLCYIDKRSTQDNDLKMRGPLAPWIAHLSPDL